MKISLEKGTASYRIRAYGAGYVQVNETRYARPLLIMPETLFPDWPVQDIATLTVDDFTAVLAEAPEIILLGTGAQQTFPATRLIAELAGHGVGLEVMDTPAACRTFNILMAEDRRVAAALLMID